MTHGGNLRDALREIVNIAEPTANGGYLTRRRANSISREVYGIARVVLTESDGPVSDPVEVMRAIDNDAMRLDELESLLDDAVSALDASEERWDEVRDATAESLKDEMADTGRKGDPAEHWIDSVARRENRTVYVNYRRARRAVDRIREQIRAKQAAMSGRQSELAALRDEVRARTYQPNPVRRSAA